MAAFQDVTAKLGNMRKAAEWTVYPIAKDETHITIQCDKRIAQIELSSGKAMLSDGKGGHQGFYKLSVHAGADVVDCPAALLEQLKTLAAKAV